MKMKMKMIMRMRIITTTTMRRREAEMKKIMIMKARKTREKRCNKSSRLMKLEHAWNTRRTKLRTISLEERYISFDFHQKPNFISVL